LTDGSRWSGPRRKKRDHFQGNIWQGDGFKFTRPQIINYSNIMYFHCMLAHKAKSPPTTHLILEASMAMEIANLAAVGVEVYNNEVFKDWGIIFDFQYYHLLSQWPVDNHFFDPEGH
jgi:hypothetical protein